MGIFDIFKKKNKAPVDETLATKDFINNDLSLIDIYRQAANGDFKFKFYGDVFSHDDFGVVDVDHWFLFKDGKLIAKYQNKPMIKPTDKDSFDDKAHYMVISREVDKKGRETFSYEKFHFDLRWNPGAHWHEEIVFFDKTGKSETIEYPDKIPEEVKKLCDYAKAIDDEIGGKNKTSAKNEEKTEPSPVEKQPVEEKKTVGLDGKSKD